MDINTLTGMYKGQSCFLICDGPSFANIDKSKLDRNGILTMGVNNSPSTFRPNLWCSVDSPTTFLESVKHDPKIIKFCPVGYRRKYKQPFVGFRTNTKFNANSFLSEDSVCYGGDDGGRSVMMAAIKVLYKLGIKNVFLLGVDFRMAEGEKNYHFDQETNPHAINTNNNSYEKLTKRFVELKDIFIDNDFHIYNCNSDSALKVFDFMSIDDAIDIAVDGVINSKEESASGLYDNPRRRHNDGNRIRKSRKDRNIEGRDGCGKDGNPIERNPRRRRRVKKEALKCERQIAISGLSRSGTHAVSDWICSQLSGNVQFRNDLKMSNGAIRDPESNNLPERFYTLPSLKYIQGSARQDIDSFVYSYENLFEGGVPLSSRIESRDGIGVQLLRDPYNLISSLMTHIENGHRFWFWQNCTRNGKIDDALLYNFSSAWCKHANIFLNDDSIVSISYNKWKDSNEYRDELFAKLKLDNRSDDSMNLVPVNGRGSSFDGLKKDGDATKMETTRRWEKYKNEDWFKKVYNDHEQMRNLSDKIFGEIVQL